VNLRADLRASFLGPGSILGFDSKRQEKRGGKKKKGRDEGTDLGIWKAS